MRELTPEERAAMALYGKEYSESRLSAIDWWKRLDPGRARVVIDFVNDMERAFRETKRITPVKRKAAPPNAG